MMDLNRSAGPNGAADQQPAGDKPKGKRRRRNRDFRGFVSSLAFVASMRPPDYLIDTLLMRGATYTLTGNTGHGKTLVALLMAVKIARGEWFCGKRCKPGTVAFFAGENPDNVKAQFYALCRDLDVDPADLSIVWHEGVFDLDQARAKTREALVAHADLALCVYDSLQAFFSGDDDSQNVQMLDTAIDFRSMAEEHRNRPVSLILAHPVKNASRDTLLPRGGSSLTNELDGNLTCWLDGEVVALHWQGKLRGIPFDPIKLEMVTIRPAGLVDAEGNQMPATVIRPLAESREAELIQINTRREIAILEAIDADPAISQVELATRMTVHRRTIQREIAALKKRKWLRQYGDKYKLTGEGKTALDLGAPAT